MDNKTIAIALVAVAALCLLRVISQWRRFSVKKEPVDWDAHFIQGLRKAGVDTFVEHTVDFFFTVPTREASDALARDLAGQGYSVDVIEAREITGQYSLHASRRMRLVISEMQQLTVHFNQLAERHGGRYDSWAVVTK
jgi:hypothetical protein